MQMVQQVGPCAYDVRDNGDEGTQDKHQYREQQLATVYCVCTQDAASTHDEKSVREESIHQVHTSPCNIQETPHHVHSYVHAKD